MATDKVPVAGGGLGYDTASLTKLAGQWDALADIYKQDESGVRSSSTTKQPPPGLEYASANTNSLMLHSTRSLTISVNDRVSFCRDQAEKCRNAIKQYEATESHHMKKIKKLGSAVPVPPVPHSEGTVG